MKGIVVAEQVADSARDGVSGHTYPQPRIYVPEIKMLIWLGTQSMFAFEGDGPSDEATVTKYIEVPDDLIKAAKALIKSQIELNGLEEVFTSLTKK